MKEYKPCMKVREVNNMPQVQEEKLFEGYETPPGYYRVTNTVFLPYDKPSGESKPIIAHGVEFQWGFRKIGLLALLREEAIKAQATYRADCETVADIGRQIHNKEDALGLARGIQEIELKVELACLRQCFETAKAECEKSNEAMNSANQCFAVAVEAKQKGWLP